MTLTPQHLPTHLLHHAHDRDGNGYVSLDEATSILQSAPFNFPASKVGHLLLRLIDWQAPPTNQRAGWAEVGHLLAKFDKDGNGKLDIEEFADFYAEAKATCVSPSHCLSLPRSHFEQNTPPICSCASLPFPPSLPTPSFFPSLPRPFFAFSSPPSFFRYDPRFSSSSRRLGLSSFSSLLLSSPYFHSSFPATFPRHSSPFISLTLLFLSLASLSSPT